jgi:two-component system chemotaxis response regulator CheB
MHHRIVVIGASAGGVDALQRLMSFLPSDFAAPIVVVLHVPADGPSVLPDILSRAGHLPALHAKDDDKLESGHVYVAPPDHHVLVDGNRLRLSRGPRENRHRPAIDPLFRTAAETRGPEVVAVVLSGALDDGTAGAVDVTGRGGRLLVQDPDEAANPSMPTHAIRHGGPSAVLRIEQLAAELVRLAEEPPDGDDIGRNMDIDGAEERGVPTHRIAGGASADDVPGATDERGDELVDVICPDCGGNLWERQIGGTLRYRCRVGHAFSLESLLDGQDDRVESALWSALHALQERADLSRRLERRLAGQPRSAARYRLRADESERRAEILHRVMIGATLDPITGPMAGVDADVDDDDVEAAGG